MRPLWPIERAVLEAAARDFHPATDGLRDQFEAAQVTAFENTGAGFFSTVTVPPEAPRIPENSPLDAATANVDGIDHGMGFLVFLENGYVSLIEGYTHSDVATVGVDFASVNFDMKPWSLAGE